MTLESQLTAIVEQLQTLNSHLATIAAKSNETSTGYATPEPTATPDPEPEAEAAPPAAKKRASKKRAARKSTPKKSAAYDVDAEALTEGDVKFFKQTVIRSAAALNLGGAPIDLIKNYLAANKDVGSLDDIEPQDRGAFIEKMVEGLKESFGNDADEDEDEDDGLGGL